MTILEFGPVTDPIYRAIGDEFWKFNRFKSNDCCDKGHATPQQAASHGASIIVSPWKKFDRNAWLDES